MKKTIIRFILLTSALCPLSSESADRVFDRVWDASVGFSQQMDVSWFAADSMVYTHRARYGSAPVALTNAGQVVVWEVMGKSGTARQTNYFLISTGVVQSAAGVVKFPVSPAQANLSTGFYTGYVRSFIKTGTNLDHNLVLAYQNIRVDWSPASSNYAVVAPLPAPQWYAYTNVMQSASGTIQRVFNRASRIEDGSSNPQPIEGFQAESWRLNESITQNGSPLDLRGTNAVFVWEITGLKYTNVFVAAVGCAINAAAGQLRFEIAPEDSNLLPGKYLGFVRSMQQGVSNKLGGGVVLAVQTITVQGSPDSRYYPIRGPLTYSIEFSDEAITNYFWTVLNQTRENLTNLTERTDWIESRTNFWDAAYGWGNHATYGYLTSLANVRTSLWDTAYGWGNHALAGYLTSFTEIDPAWHSGTGALWEAISTISLTPGPAGSNGVAGVAGQNGTNGLSAYEIAVGAGFVGSSNAWLASLVGVAGVAGQNGTNGLSAYQLAVSTGFVGSVEAWLISLRGATGSNGLDGAIGPAGTNDAAQIAAISQSITNLSGDIMTLADVTNSCVVFDGNNYLYDQMWNGRPEWVNQNGYVFNFQTQGWVFYQFSYPISYTNSSRSFLLPLDGWYTTNGVATNLNIQFFSGVNYQQQDQLDSTGQRVERVVAGTDAFEGIRLDTKINSWGDIGLTYTNAVRLNFAITITNDATWTGWTTTGSLLTNGVIFLTDGQYLQSPVQSNGVSSVTISSGSDMNGTAYTQQFLDGTNVFYYPYAGTGGVFKITADSTLSTATPGLYVSNIVFVGYASPTEAATDKTVSGLKIIDPPVTPQDAVNKLYSDNQDEAARAYFDSSLNTYSNNTVKTLFGSQLRLNQGWSAVTANGQEYILSCGQISGDGQLLGTSNYFAFAQNDYPLLTFSSDATGLFISSNSIAYPDPTNRTVTLYIATNGVLSAPYAEWTKDLKVGSWTHVMTYSTNTYPTPVGSNYVLQFSAPTGSKGYFRAMQPSGQSRITVSANILDLGSNVIKNISAVWFTNGCKIVCVGTNLVTLNP